MMQYTVMQCHVSHCHNTLFIYYLLQPKLQLGLILSIGHSFVSCSNLSSIHTASKHTPVLQLSTLPSIPQLLHHPFYSSASRLAHNSCNYTNHHTVRHRQYDKSANLRVFSHSAAHSGILGLSNSI